MNGTELHTNIGLGAEGRQAAIAQMLLERDFISVEELASRFEVATQTIRRDINGMCEQGIARRRHGGIESIPGGRNIAFRDRRIMHREAKVRIAATVARQIADGTSLSLGIGTTAQLVAEALLFHRELKIVTNNLPLAVTVAENQSFTVAISGGTVRGDELDTGGAPAEEFFASYRVDVAIFGVAGVDADGSLLEFSENEVRVRETMRRNCRKSYLVLDASKFDRAAHVRGGRIDQVSAVFCETEPPDAIRRMLDQAGVQFFNCSGLPSR